MWATAGFAVGAAVGLKIEPKKRTTVVLIRDNAVLGTN